MILGIGYDTNSIEAIWLNVNTESIEMSGASIRQVKAARALLGWSQTELAIQSGISEPTVKRLEAADGHEPIGGRPETAEAIQRALESAGIIFVAENGEGPGVRLRKALAADN